MNAATNQAARFFLDRVRDLYDVREAYLFGSQARQQAGVESDTDIALLLRGKLEGGQMLQPIWRRSHLM